MRSRLLALITFCMTGLLSMSTTFAEGPAIGSSPPPLGAVTWLNQGTSFEALKGKTVVVLTYVTWCPICNGWSKEALSGMIPVIADKPVVVLAISTDTQPAKGQAYMKERGIVGPQTLYGYDPTIANRFGFTNKFFNYVIVDPDSKVVASGNLGSRYAEADGSVHHSIERDVRNRPGFGRYQFVTDDMSDALKELVFPLELGGFPTASDTAKMKRGLKAEDRQAFDKTLNLFLDARLADAKLDSEGEAAEKLSAFETATYLSLAFKATEQGKDAKKLLVELNKDKDLKKELTAKRLYDELMKLPATDPARATGIRSLTKKFPDTYYSKVANGVDLDDE